MAKGETRYESKGRPVHRFDNKPLPVNIYPLTLQGGDEVLQVKRSEAKGPDAIPYINTRFGADGTRSKPEGKDRLVFHKFFLSMKPGSDGIIMPERGGGIVEYCRAHGEEASFTVRTLVKEDKTTEDYFDPEEVLEYLQSKADTTLEAKVIIEAQKDLTGAVDKNHPGNNKIAFWNLSPEAMTGEVAEEEKPAPKVQGNTLAKKKK